MVSDDDRKVFKQAMKDVKPLNAQPRHHDQPPKKKAGKLPSIDRTKDQPDQRAQYRHPKYDPYHQAEAQADTILSYSRGQLPARTLAKLKKGQISLDRRLDLHGYTAEQAIEAVSRVLTNPEVRCFLLIHGKGKYSGEAPILKNIINQWIRTQPRVLAFHSAIAKHGGSGAIYVLLKKN